MQGSVATTKAHDNSTLRQLWIQSVATQNSCLTIVYNQHCAIKDNSEKERKIQTMDKRYVKYTEIIPDVSLTFIFKSNRFTISSIHQ